MTIAVPDAASVGTHILTVDLRWGDWEPREWTEAMSMTIPQSTGHIPTVHDYKPSGRGYYHQPGSPDQLGRDYVFSSPAPLWAFGFGLSYTTFAYVDLKVETSVIAIGGDAVVSFIVKNTGLRAGKEVAQVYIGDEVSSVTTPVMKLARFEKLTLEPGEEQRVRITIPSLELSLWNREMKRVIEPGFFIVMVGASAEEIKLRGRFEVVGASGNQDQERPVRTGTVPLMKAARHAVQLRWPS